MIRFILFLIQLLPPEISHFLTIKFLKLGFGQNFIKQSFNQSPILKQFIWDLEFINPIGLAAGFDKNGEVIDQTLKLGFGFVEIGTVTPEPQYGNDKPRIFRLVKDKAIINHLGFNNEGKDKVKNRLSKRKDDITSISGVLGLNIGKNSNTTDLSNDYTNCILTLGPYVDYMVINISSPNTPGLRNLQNRGYLENLIISIKQNIKDDSILKNKPLLIKIAPDLDEEQKRDIALTSLAQGINGIIVSNTTLKRSDSLKDKNKNEIGGLSGKPLFLPSTLLLREMYNLTGGKIPLIGVGGISTGKDVYEKIKAGASLVQLYTGLVFEGPQIINNINKELYYLLRADGFNNISEAIGSDVLWKNQ